MMWKPVWIFGVTSPPVREANGLVDAVDTDLVRVLGDERLDGAVLQLVDLVRAGVEADDLDLVLLVGLPDTGGGAGGREGVGGEDADDVGVLGQRRRDQPGRRGGVVVAVLHAEVVELGVRLGGRLEALDAGVDGRDAGVGRHDQDLAAVRD